MSDPAVTADTVLSGAMGPNSVTVDGMAVTSGDTTQQLAALQVAEANRNARKKRRGLAYARIVPGSAVGGPGSSITVVQSRW